MRERRLTLVSLLCLLLAVGIIVHNSGWGNSLAEAEGPRMASVTVQVDDAVIFHDIAVYASIEQLTDAADAVVLGRVVSKGGSKNLARGVGNASADRVTMSQEYSFAVKSYLKGSGDDRIDIVYGDYTIYQSGPGAGKRIPEPNSALETGKEYVLFLSKVQEDNSGFYSRIGEPWQFRIDGGAVKTISVVNDLDASLLDLTESDLFRLIQEAVQGAKGK